MPTRRQVCKHGRITKTYIGSKMKVVWPCLHTINGNYCHFVPSFIKLISLWFTPTDTNVVFLRTKNDPLSVGELLKLTTWAKILPFSLQRKRLFLKSVGGLGIVLLASTGAHAKVPLVWPPGKKQSLKLSTGGRCVTWTSSEGQIFQHTIAILKFIFRVFFFFGSGVTGFLPLFKHWRQQANTRRTFAWNSEHFFAFIDLSISIMF